LYKLLIVDDESFVLDGLFRNIKWNELEVGSVELATDGADALEKAIKFKPNIILSDIKMVPMDGIELVSHIKDILPDCKIIFMSAYSDKEFLKSAINFKAVNYVEKPIELEEVKSSIISAIKLCKEDEKKKLAEQPLQSSIVLELISDNFNKDKVMTYLSASECGNILDRKFCVAVINYRSTLSNIKNNVSYIKKEVLQISDNVFSKNGIGYLYSFMENGNIIFIIYNKLEGSYLNISAVKKIFQEILDIFRCKIDIFISIGSIVNSIDEIYCSFQEAEDSAKELFFTGYDHLITSSVQRIESYDLFENNTAEFSKLIEIGEMVKAIEYIKKLTKKIRLNKNLSANYIKDIYFSLMVQLLNVATKHRIKLFQGHSEDFIWQILSHCITLDEVEEYAIKTIMSFCAEIEKDTYKIKVVPKVIDVINERYNDPELSIKEISKKVFLNHTYLCAVFKKETGKTINQYITEFRIEKAKELLIEDSTIKISAIGRNVGYPDQNYFTKIFKKIVNITPSEYRERYCKC